ncbi:2-oxoacid:acceptor oxidoreductase family protein [Chloroflexota bacterium]
MSKREQVIFGGFGGQGIIMAGLIVGKAAAINAGQNSTFTQDYGPEARGGACRAQIVISDGQITYPYVDDPSAVVVMSQEAYTKYTAGIRSEILVLVDEELVKVNPKLPNKVYQIPATRIAGELGRAAVANIVMVGFFTAISKILSKEQAKNAVLDTIPKGTEELNTRAFERGYEYGAALLKRETKKSK